jgi:hypothetical protein
MIFLFFFFYVSLFLIFVMECNVVVLIIHNISYTTISIKVVTETIIYSQMCNMGAKRMMGIIIVLNTFSILVASWGYF